jgi:hypothetical protein
MKLAPVAGGTRFAWRLPGVATPAYLRAIDIIKKRHFSSRVPWSFIVPAYPARCLTEGAELRPA